MALSDSMGVVIAAAIASVPATIAAINSIKTRKSVRTPNGTTLGQNSETAANEATRVRALLEAHIDDPEAHHAHRIAGKK